MTEHITVIAYLRAQAGKSQELGERLLALVAPSRAEEGCISYDAHQSLEDPDLWCMYENWRSAADIDSHFQTPYLRQFAADLPQLLEGELDLRRYVKRSV